MNKKSAESLQGFAEANVFILLAGADSVRV
jgi:hypothetical protein